MKRRSPCAPCGAPPVLTGKYINKIVTPLRVPYVSLTRPLRVSYVLLARPHDEVVHVVCLAGGVQQLNGDLARPLLQEAEIDGVRRLALRQLGKVLDQAEQEGCLLYTSDAADDTPC
eukprot:83194-Prorocentrum_minimum.AAC.2